MKRLAQQIDRSLPYTVSIGVASGAVLDGYEMGKRRRFPFTGIMCGFVAGAGWPILIPLGVLVGSGIMISDLNRSKD